MKIADKQKRQNKIILDKTRDQENCHQTGKPAKKQLISTRFRKTTSILFSARKDRVSVKFLLVKSP